jgi:maltose O-acetyltransferase
MRFLVYFFYKILAANLPKSSVPYIGKLGRKCRGFCCIYLFRYTGIDINIEKGAAFGYGSKISLGDRSGLGRYCRIPDDISIGNDVMMGPYVTIYSANHAFNRIDIPMNQQGHTASKQTVIEDDVWIGSHVIMTPGRYISRGSIIAAGSVLTKDFPEYSIIGGNPAKIIGNRLK